VKGVFDAACDWKFLISRFLSAYWMGESFNCISSTSILLAALCAADGIMDQIARTRLAKKVALIPNLSAAVLFLVLRGNLPHDYGDSECPFGH